MLGIRAKPLTVWVMLSGFVYLNASSALAAQQKQLRLKWSELTRVVLGQKATMILPSGASIEGKVLAVEPDILVIDITKTSDSRAYPKGQASVPRSSVSVLNVKKVQYRWRVIGTAIGAGTGLLAGWFMALLIAADEKPRPAATAAFVGITGGLATVGYFAGQKADRQITVITIVPELPPDLSKTSP